MNFHPGKKYWVLGILWVFFFFSCVNKEEESEKRAAEPAAAREGREIQQWFSSPVLGEWFHRLQQEDSTLKETGFLLGSKDSLQINVAEQQFGEEDWRIYQPYFFYAPGKDKAVDLYSYGTMPVKQGDGSVKLEHGEADNEVSLVDVQKRTKRRLLFSGPGTVYQSAAWVGDSVVVITGTSDANEENQQLPVIWEINFLDSTVKIFNYNPLDSLVSPP